jgi:hypothetical protein
MRLIGWAVAVVLLSFSVHADPSYWKREWPKTDFSKTSVEYSEILSGGPPKDGIPSIDNPKFVEQSEIDNLAPTEPVIGLVIGGEAKAYPLRILIWHEIVNDEIGGMPVAVTYCPLCNAAIVFDRRVGDKVLEFGTTGKLRRSDLVMYDRTSESWWQQFTGEAIVGEMLGVTLKFVPARLESYANFQKRAPAGRVLVPNRPSMRRYGANPYVDYDSSTQPFLYRGKLPENVAPLSRVVAVEGRAWSLDLVRKKRRFETDDGLIVTWEPGQNSAMDAPRISEGQDVGNVVVQKHDKASGKLVDVPYRIDFAFAYFAFRPNIKIEIE